MDVGQPVEVYSAFEQIWTPGFQIADVVEGGYVLRRLSDGWVLPYPTSLNDLRATAPHHCPA